MKKQQETHKNLPKALENPSIEANNKHHANFQKMGSCLGTTLGVATPQPWRSNHDHTNLAQWPDTQISSASQLRALSFHASTSGPLVKTLARPGVGKSRGGEGGLQKSQYWSKWCLVSTICSIVPVLEDLHTCALQALTTCFAQVSCV